MSLTSNDTCNDLRNLNDLLARAELTIQTNHIVIRHLGSTQRVSWKNKCDTTMTSLEYGSISEYVSYVECHQFNTILNDGSLLQMSYDFKRDTLKGYRLCYYPCPFDLDKELLIKEPLLELVNLYAESGSSSIRLRSPIRFDYAIDSANEGHSAAHVHINHKECRVPVVSPLSVGHFIDFVFRNFYPETWQLNQFLREWKRDLGIRCILPTEESSLHIACSRA